MPPLILQFPSGKTVSISVPRIALSSFSHPQWKECIYLHHHVFRDYYIYLNVNIYCKITNPQKNKNKKRLAGFDEISLKFIKLKQETSSRDIHTNESEDHLRDRHLDVLVEPQVTAVVELTWDSLLQGTGLSIRKGENGQGTLSRCHHSLSLQGLRLGGLSSWDCVEGKHSVWLPTR